MRQLIKLINNSRKGGIVFPITNPIFLFLLSCLIAFCLFIINITTQFKSQIPFWNTIYSMGSGFAMSVIAACIFNHIVVYIPEQNQRKIIKDNIRKDYKNIKRNIAQEIIAASKKGGRPDLSGDEDTIEKMLTITGFRELFKGGREANEGFNAFKNQMTHKTQEYNEIIFNLRMLSQSVARILNNYRIDNQAIYDFFRRLEIFIAHIEHTNPGYDESKPFFGFLWEIFGGWNIIDGDVGHDVVEKLLDEF